MKTIKELISYLPVAESIPFLIFFNIASVLRMHKTKSSNDVSLIAQITMLIVQYLYIVYGFLIVNEWQYLFSCFLASGGATAVLVTTIYYRIKNKGDLINGQYT